MRILADVTKTDAPLILLGGVIDQFVSTQSSKVDGHTIYIHVGGNVWINSFGLGTHSDGSQSTPHVPVSVTGGEFPGFYLTGTYKAGAAVRTDDAECYISGGHFHEAAGASLEQINGNVHWQIYNADIDNFFGGGTNDAKPIKGDITTDIYNSNVGLFCGGPKFGNMQADKKVTTNAEGCIFGKYFGAGYGGTSLSRKKYYDKDGIRIGLHFKATIPPIEENILTELLLALHKYPVKIMEKKVLVSRPISTTNSLCGPAARQEHVYMLISPLSL